MSFAGQVGWRRIHHSIAYSERTILTKIEYTHKALAKD